VWLFFLTFSRSITCFHNNDNIVQTSSIHLGEVSVPYINHFNVQNMRQTIKLTLLFCNLVPSLLYKCSVNCSEKSYIPFVFISISLKCMLSEHSSERKRFLIRKGGKNADLIGKESLWIYTVKYEIGFNWLIWKQKVCKTFLSSSRNISIIIVTQNSLKMVSWPIFWTKSVTL
jgi:hypothetical protein